MVQELQHELEAADADILLQGQRVLGQGGAAACALASPDIILELLRPFAADCRLCYCPPLLLRPLFAGWFLVQVLPLEEGIKEF